MIKGGDIQRISKVTCGLPMCPNSAKGRRLREKLNRNGWERWEVLGWVCDEHPQHVVRYYQEERRQVGEG